VAIDASIPLQVQPPAPIDPLAALAKVMQLRQMQQQGEHQTLALEQQRRAGADIKALDDAYASGLDREGVLSRLPGHLRPTVQKQFADADEASLKVQKLRDETVAAERDYFGSLAAGVKPYLSDPDGGMGAALIALQHAKEKGYKDADAIWQRVSQDPSQLAPIVQQLIAQSPKQVELGNSATSAAARTAAAAKPTEATLAVEAAKGDPAAVAALDRLKPAPKTTTGDLDVQAQALYQKRAAGRPLAPEEQAALKAYEDRKTVVTDAAAVAAQSRTAAATNRQTDLLQRREDFAMQQAGRKELTDKVEAPYLQARQSAQELRDTIEAAKAGNMTAAQQQALQTTIASIRSQGLNRINLAEIRNTERAGNLWNNIQAGFGKLVSGQPMPAKLQQDTLEFADLLEKGAYEKYAAGHKQVTTRYKLADEKALEGPAKKPTVTVPENVAATLKGQKPGRYTLSDGSVWVVAPNGLIAPGK
jgi:hypothetical protein